MLMKEIVCSYSCFQKKSKYVSIACGGYLGMQQNIILIIIITVKLTKPLTP